MKYYGIVETELGFIAIANKDGKLTHCTLPKASREEALSAMDAGLDESFVEDIAAFGSLPDKLIRYCKGERVEFSDVQIDTSHLGPFHATVQLAAQRIPYGTLMTYGDLAKTAGTHRAARAAGSAMARNTMLIVIPCHRVVSSGGKIGGFACGLEWKRAMLKLEGVDI